MDKELWKEIIGVIPDTELIRIIKSLNIKIKGFRELNTKNISSSKKIVTVQLMNNSEKIIKYYNNLNIKPMNSGKQISSEYIRSLGKEKLITLYEDGLNLHFIFGALLSSEKTEHHNIAKDFKILILKKYQKNNLAEIQMNKDNEQSGIAQNVKVNVKKIEKKLDEYKKKNQQLTKELNTLSKKYKEDIKVLTDSNNVLKKELKSEKETSKANEKKMVEINSELFRYNQQLREAQEMLSNTNEVASSIEEAQNLFSEILILGDPQNEIIDNLRKKGLNVVNTRDILQISNTDFIKSFSEIWILSFLVPAQYKRRIKIEKNQLINDFKDFKALREELERRMNG
ncbi:V-type ATP synthase subunit I domain-containing protein [Bacillus altitudinis]|uniref:Uncharacterized protein n=1 Tax=Bacillus altitudinis TaxID=293387 RepID=A0A653UMC6_BACAB|nr:hypothetical protein [Bacillus altitudinis]KWZ65489.1 hypothetical protein HQ51_0215670 [Bacillus altitudinis]MED0682301.1 hypothetical protein [Bacillus altitudinis]NEU53822.1 hypothetical protein [Bacillus altitudinis]NQD50618.1 hypothetical protein [Bacillus altitudinis]QKJ41237.1 hypothetical protein HRJ37_13925 [Bacillus altitudinis]